MKDNIFTDAKFVLWLWKQMLVLTVKGDLAGAKEAWHLYRFHVSHNRRRLE